MPGSCRRVHSRLDEIHRILLSYDSSKGASSLERCSCNISSFHEVAHATTQGVFFCNVWFASAAVHQGRASVHEWEEIVKRVRNTANPRRTEVLGPQVSEFFFIAVLLGCSL